MRSAFPRSIPLHLTLNYFIIISPMHDQASKLTSQKLQSLMYQLQRANFDTFPDMLKYLQQADNMLTQKVDRLNLKIDTVKDELVRCSSVYEMNNRKRQMEEEALRAEREKIQKDIQGHRERLAGFVIDPITLVLKQKKFELEKLNQTKEIIEEFTKLVKGKQDEIKKILPLDQKNFNKSALKIYVFKVLLDDINGLEHANAKLQINKKYTELKSKIIQNFKQGYWNNDLKLIRGTLPYCEEYQLLDQIIQFYNQQTFKSVHKITKLNCQMQAGSERDRTQQMQQGEAEIKNMFFLIQQCFHSAFSEKDENTGELNQGQVGIVMGEFAEVASRKLVTYVFEKIIKESLENILKATAILASGSASYLLYLEIFYDQCKKLVKSCESIIKEEKVLHLMSTYFESTFDVYLDTYINKQLNNLDETYEKCTQELTRDITQNAVNGATQYTRDRQKNNIFSDDTKKTFTRLLFDFAIESKKGITSSNNISANNILNNTTNEAMKKKIQDLLKLFMNPLLQKIFSTTKRSLARNKKIAKINQIDKNRNEILQLFLSNIEQIIQNLISLISEIVPSFDERAPPLQPDFFQLVPHISMLLHRIEFMYEQYKKENSYRLADSIKLDQKKQTLMLNCGKSLNKVVAQAMATILGMESSILQQDANQYNVTSPQKHVPNDSTTKLIGLLERYIRVIQKITLNNFRASLLKTLGLQFVNHLIKYYSQITYTKEGLSRIFMDIAKFKTMIQQFYSDEVEVRFKILRSLIDLYVLKNDEKAIEEYLKTEAVLNKQELKKTIEVYVLNKIKCEKEKNK